MLTADVIHPDGPASVEVGLDHYMLDPLLGEKSLSLFRAMLLYVGDRETSGQPAAEATGSDDLAP